MKLLHQRYIEAVLSGPHGLFSRGDVARLAEHVADGVAGASMLRDLGARSIVDIGSGGGVPAFPVAIELEDATIDIVESLGWKTDFLLACACALSLESRVKVHALRAEEAPAALGRELRDAGIARAVAAPVVVAEYLAPLVRVGGHLVLWSTAALASMPVSAEAHAALGLGSASVVAAPSPLRSDGVLIVWPRVAPCSERFPRRTGVAAKRPLR